MQVEEEELTILFKQICLFVDGLKINGYCCLLPECNPIHPKGNKGL